VIQLLVVATAGSPSCSSRLPPDTTGSTAASAAMRP